MPTAPKPHQEPIPQSLREQLEHFRRRLWRIKMAEAVLAGAFGLLCSFLLVFGLDRLWPTPPAVRLGILLAGTSLFVLFAPYWLHRWVFGHRCETQLARLIARRYPRLGDRLLGIIELQDQVESAESLSPRLRSAAMEHVADEAKRRQFEQALPPSMHRRWSLGVLALLLLAGTALTLAPRAGLNSLQRWLLPLSDTPRYTFTKLTPPPARLIVPFGEAFDLALALAPDSEWQPADGLARFATQPPVTATLADGRYRFEFPGQQAPGTVRIQIGDARHQTVVEPTLRPTADRLTATIDHPEYLGIEPRITDLRGGALTVVDGSRVTFRFEASRDLSRATLGPARPDGTPEPPAAASHSAPPEPAAALPMTTRGPLAESPPITVTGPPRTIPFAWTDALGLAGDSGFQVRVEPVPDAAPLVYLQGVERQHVMLAEETVDLEALVDDDFGVRSCGLAWQGEFTRPTDATPAKGELELVKGAPTLRRVREAAAFSPGALGIEPQKLLLRAFAEDYLPGRGRAYSEPITLFILTRDEHAQLLKSQFDRIIGELEDLARRELDQFDENQRLDRLDGQQLQDELNRERLRNQQDAERESAERMRQLADATEELFKDATRNGEIDKDTLKKMAGSLQAMKELGRHDLPSVEQKLGEAGDPRSTEEQADQDMSDAVERQRDAVEKLQQAIDQANEANRQFEAGTFVNRLKKAASEQDGIAASLIEAFDRVLGLSREELDPADQRRADSLVGQQSQTASDIRWIQEDLGHFFARTAKEEHRKLLDAMRESKIDLALDDLRQRLQRNETFLSVDQSKHWADQLREWAKQLEGDNQAAGGGGGGGASDPENEDFEFMLRVMRLVQQEQDLRGRTRALEQFRRSLDNPNPPAP